MRAFAAFLVTLCVAAAAHAACPGCFAGGGPAATDCFVEFGGVAADGTLTCTDGDVSDADGKFDGTCTAKLQVCINVTGDAACTSQALSRPLSVKPGGNPVGRGLATAVQGLALSGEQCVDVLLPIPATAPRKNPTKAKKTRLVVTARSGSQRDVDKLKIVAQPALAFVGTPGAPTPSLANDVQPILTARCAYAPCHAAPAPAPVQDPQDLETGNTFAQTVNVRSAMSTLPRITPGSVKDSFLARKILGQGIGRNGGAVMPQICPGAPPAGGCLTDDEIRTILEWIAGGAPND